jgi:hypothetical protein
MDQEQVGIMKKAAKLWKPIKSLAAVLGVLAVIGGAIYGVPAWVHKEAQNAVLNEKFLGTLAARIRPTCVFDSRGAIEADLGAMEYLEDIRVTPAPQVYGFEVVVKANRHLAYAPLVTGISADLFPQSATRGRLHEWRIVLSPSSTAPGLLIGDMIPTPYIVSNWRYCIRNWTSGGEEVNGPTGRAARTATHFARPEQKLSGSG